MLHTFAIDTLGCKVNQYESRQIHTLLTDLGLESVAPQQKPDLTIVNTCCVTKTASAKSRQYIRRAVKLNHGSTVVVLGCLTAAPGQELNSVIGRVFLIKNRPNIAAELSKIVLNNTAPKELQGSHFAKNRKMGPPKSPLYISRTATPSIKPQNRPQIKAKNRSNSPKLPDLTAFMGHTRAFLKAQDGCDSYCTYCIIPIVRPNIESRPIDSICREAEHLAESGHKEIVLTGICLGAFGRPTTRRQNWIDPENDYLAKLLDNLAAVPNLLRLRVSSLNPHDITPQLLDVFTKHTNIIMPHLHLSLQSGSDAILRKMARQYTAADYLEKVQMIKDSLDNPSVTTDIIVGFPGETDSDFAQTVNLCETVGFARIHVFSFSARKGTSAEKMTPKVKSQVIKERAKTLQTLADRLAYEYRNKFIGRTERVLIESVENGFATGHAERYFEVRISNPDNKLKKNDVVEIALDKNLKTGLLATMKSKVKLSKLLIEYLLERSSLEPA
jgi:threonylcarbamoyladenosine tRNA methylthiotransferase MtaB